MTSIENLISFSSLCVLPHSGEREGIVQFFDNDEYC